MKFKPQYFVVFALFMMLCFGACKPPAEPADDNDRLLAQAFNKSLYLSELTGMVPENSSPEDSSLIVNAYIERWVRENLLMHEAEKNVPHDLNIDELDDVELYFYHYAVSRQIPEGATAAMAEGSQAAARTMPFPYNLRYESEPEDTQ